jgi:hypothetical protein
MTRGKCWIPAGVYPDFIGAGMTKYEGFFRYS